MDILSQANLIATKHAFDLEVVQRSEDEIVLAKAEKAIAEHNLQAAYSTFVNLLPIFRAKMDARDKKLQKG